MRDAIRLQLRSAGTSLPAVWGALVLGGVLVAHAGLEALAIVRERRRMSAASRFARGAAVLIGIIAAAGGLFAALARIEPLLPPENGSVCFNGAFSGDQTLIQGFPGQANAEEVRVTAIRLKLNRPGGQEPHWDRAVGWGWDWRYDLTLEITTPGRSYQGTGALCNWSKHPVSHLEPSLLCYIDCDGGGIAMRRVPGRSAIDVVWDAGNWLRMSACGGGGVILRAGGTSKSFRVERTSCAGAP